MDYDILVIGGGPAGAVAAAAARLRGLRVCVVEKESFPRFRIGESLLPNGNALLKAVGAWEKIAAAGFIRKHGAFFFSGYGDEEKEVIFSNCLVPGLDYTFQVERSRFDQLLLEHARSLGADIRMRSAVVRLQADRESCSIELTSPEGPCTLRGRWILDASGRESSFSHELKKQLDPPRLPRRVAVYNHFRGVPRAEGLAAGHTTVVRLAGGWFWIIPLDHERTSVGLVTSAERFRGGAKTPGDVFWREVRQSPRLRQLLHSATPTESYRVTTDYSYFRRSLARERVLLLGDAGGFFDPIFSSGVYVAMRSALKAVELLEPAHREDRCLAERECTRYTRDLKAQARVFEKLIHAFYDEFGFEVLLSSHVPLKIDRAVASILAGHTDLTWPLRWRFHAFLLVCKLQRFVPISKRLALSRHVVQDGPEPDSGEHPSRGDAVQTGNSG